MKYIYHLGLKNAAQMAVGKTGFANLAVGGACAPGGRLDLLLTVQAGNLITYIKYIKYITSSVYTRICICIYYVT